MIGVFIYPSVVSCKLYSEFSAFLLAYVLTSYMIAINSSVSRDAANMLRLYALLGKYARPICVRIAVGVSNHIIIAPGDLNTEHYIANYPKSKFKRFIRFRLRVLLLLHLFLYNLIVIHYYLHEYS